MKFSDKFLTPLRAETSSTAGDRPVRFFTRGENGDQAFAEKYLPSQQVQDRPRD